MDARPVETLAAALGHAPHRVLLRQVLAGIGPAHTLHLLARTRRWTPLAVCGEGDVERPTKQESSTPYVCGVSGTGHPAWLPLPRLAPGARQAQLIWTMTVALRLWNQVQVQDTLLPMRASARHALGVPSRWQGTLSARCGNAECEVHTRMSPAGHRRDRRADLDCTGPVRPSPPVRVLPGL